MNVTISLRRRRLRMSPTCEHTMLDTSLADGNPDVGNRAFFAVPYENCARFAAPSAIFSVVHVPSSARNGLVQTGAGLRGTGRGARRAGEGLGKEGIPLMVMGGTGDPDADGGRLACVLGSGEAGGGSGVGCAGMLGMNGGTTGGPDTRCGCARAGRARSRSSSTGGTTSAARVWAIRGRRGGESGERRRGEGVEDGKIGCGRGEMEEEVSDEDGAV